MLDCFLIANLSPPPKTYLIFPLMTSNSRKMSFAKASITSNPPSKSKSSSLSSSSTYGLRGGKNFHPLSLSSPPPSSSSTEYSSEDDFSDNDDFQEALGHLVCLVGKLREFFADPERVSVPAPRPFTGIRPSPPYDSLVLMYEEVVSRTLSLETKLLAAKAQIVALTTPALPAISPAVSPVVPPAPTPSTTAPVSTTGPPLTTTAPTPTSPFTAPPPTFVSTDSTPTSPTVPTVYSTPTTTAPAASTSPSFAAPPAPSILTVLRPTAPPFHPAPTSTVPTPPCNVCAMSCAYPLADSVPTRPQSSTPILGDEVPTARATSVRPTHAAPTRPALLTSPNIVTPPASPAGRKRCRRRRRKRSKPTTLSLPPHSSPYIRQPPQYFYSPDLFDYCPIGPGCHSFTWVDSLRCWSSPRLYHFPPLLEVPPPQLTIPPYAPAWSGSRLPLLSSSLRALGYAR